MDRVLRLWSAVSWWLVPLAIIALGAVGMAQNDSLFSEGSKTTFSGPAVVHAGFLLLVTVPLCWRFRAPVAVLVLVTASSAAWILAMFTAQDQPPFEPSPAGTGSTPGCRSRPARWPCHDHPGADRR